MNEELTISPVSSARKVTPAPAERFADANIPVGHIDHSTLAVTAWTVPPSPAEHGP
jgi:hypothetical protein